MCRVGAAARAFAALMRRVKEVDGDTGTVLMVQVENEVVVIPNARGEWRKGRTLGGDDTARVIACRCVSKGRQYCAYRCINTNEELILCEELICANGQPEFVRAGRFVERGPMESPGRPQTH